MNLTVLLFKTLFALVSFLSFTSVCGLIIYDYNRVNFQEYENLESLKSVVFPREVTIKNALIGVADDNCMDLLTSPAFRGAQRHAGGEILEVATIHKHLWPIEFDDCAQIYFYKVGSGLMDPAATQTKLDHNTLNPWIGDLMRTRITITNNFDFSITLFWHEESRDPVDQGILKPGDHTSMGTFIGHIFSAKRTDTITEDSQHNVNDGEEKYFEGGKGEIVDYFVVSGAPYSLNEKNRLETCDTVSLQNRFLGGEDDVDQSVGQCPSMQVAYDLIECLCAQICFQY